MNKTINCKGTLIDFSKPMVMGILNLSADSFYDGGHYGDLKKALFQVEKMISEGVDFIDIGAASSKPGSKLIDSDEEKNRLLNIFEALRKEFPDSLFSIDTYNSSTAAACLERGAVIINDISSGSIDPNMMETVAQHQGVYVAMHMVGTPENMQDAPKYKNITEELLLYFSKIKQKAFDAGITDLIIDPGFGFGKTIEQNYEFLNNLEMFHRLDCPLLIGLSRKSLIYKVLESNPSSALNGTTALHALSLYKGANILRVHDVKEAKECITLLNMLQ